MGVRVDGLDACKRFLEERAARYERAVVDDLNYLGMKAVRFIRNRDSASSWIDRTGNLRSSIGYIVVLDGVVIGASDFSAVTGPEGAGSEGAGEGRRYAEKLASKFRKGYALIVVAGMNYAAYVEKMDNKDVLASGELFLKNEVASLKRKYYNA